MRRRRFCSNTLLSFPFFFNHLSMRTIKLKLPFDNTTGIADRHSKLFLWAKTLVNSATVNVIDEQHYDNVSYIVVENTYKPTPESELK